MPANALNNGKLPECDGDNGNLPIANGNLPSDDGNLPCLPPKPSNDNEAIAVGRELLSMKARLRGGFLKLFEDVEAPYSYRTAARLMNLARQNPPAPVQPMRGFGPMPELAPTILEDACSMSDDETEQLIAIIRDGIDMGYPDGSLGKFPRMGGAMAAAIEQFPHARYADLLQAARVAKLHVWCAQLEIEALIDIIGEQPAEGLVSSSPLAIKCKADADKEE